MGKKKLPFLEKSLNFFLPDFDGLSNALKNYGFEIVDYEFPYLKTPYCNFVTDHIKFLANIITLL